MPSAFHNRLGSIDSAHPGRSRRRLDDICNQTAREKFAAERAEKYLQAIESDKPRHRPVRHQEWRDEELWFWWDEPCWAELIHALLSYSLEGQAMVLEQHLRRILPDPQAVVRPTILELHETERLVLREIVH